MKAIKSICIISALFMISLICPAQEKIRLPKKSLLWLERDAALIITTAEKEVFLQLKSESSRESFTDEFWRQRDPNLETRDNEFRLEHYRRIAFADDKFGRTKGKDGWRTDRGKYYVILGKPGKMESFTQEGIHPLEIWSYDMRYSGLPPRFRLMFYQPQNGGDFLLYNPLSDHPSILVSNDNLSVSSQSLPAEIESKIQGLNYSPQDRQAWKLLSERLGTSVAETCLSFIPSANRSSRPELQALLKNISSFPYSMVDPGYPAGFLSGQAQAEQAVNTSLHDVGSQSLIRVLLDPSGLFYVHYGLSPEQLSLVLSRGNHITNIKTSLLLSNQAGETALQEVRDTKLELTSDEIGHLCDARFQMYDAFPAIPGRYTLNLILENQAGKEFFSLEKSLTIPESGYPWMSVPVLTKNIIKNASAGNHRLPFSSGDFHFYPSLDQEFSSSDRMHAFLQLRGLESASSRNALLEIIITQNGQKSMEIRKGLKEYNDLESIVEEFDLSSLSAGKYQLEARLVEAGGEEILKQNQPFSIINNPQKIWIFPLDIPLPEDPRMAFILGMQYLNRNDREMAYQYLAQANKNNRDSYEYGMAFARVLSTRNEWTTMIEVLEPFSRRGRKSFELAVFLGRAYQNNKQYENAATQFLRALSYRGYVTSVLNDLGECYILMGNTERALWAWEKSLEMRPGQSALKKKLENLKK